MFINSIPVKTDYHPIMVRLGYKKKTAEVSESFLKEVKGYIDETAFLLDMKASAERIKILRKEEESVILDLSTFRTWQDENNFTIKSRSLAKFLKDSNEVLLMGITGGKAVMEAVEEYQKSDMTRAVVIDAAAGEIVDSGLDYIMSLYTRNLVRESKKLLSGRFSPGYGDLGLEIQKTVYDILNLDRLGITLTDSFMMIPQKSVIAVTGIS